MDRRFLVKAAGAAMLLQGSQAAATGSVAPAGFASRPRPGEPTWPSAGTWDELRRAVDGRLAPPPALLDMCRREPEGEACSALFRELKNPYFIGDDPALTQTCGWVDGWTAQPSAWVVTARETRHVVAAVDFARRHNLRLVVRGGAHSYLGQSTAPDSLMIWTRAMNGVVLHDAFAPDGAAGEMAPAPAVTVGAGAIWTHVYDAVTTKGGRYVQGGGCGTVGVAGLIQGGGFGTYSKRFGAAAASLLEAEVVTADGAVRVVNAYRDPDLFWALKGGGGGTFGIVTRLTLRTYDLPETFGVVATDIRADTDDGFRRLVARFVSLYAQALLNPHWGELVEVRPGRRLRIRMNFQGLNRDEAAAVWRPFLDWVSSDPDLKMTPPTIVAGPGRLRWDGAALDAVAPGTVLRDDRPGAPANNVFWSANLAEAGHVIHGFDSLWLPAALLDPPRQPELVDALVAASRLWTVELHFQKGLAGAPPDVIAASADTPLHPAASRAFALAIIAGEGPPAFPDLPGRMPDVVKARRDADRIARAKAELAPVAPEGGAYLAEGNYHEAEWQRSFWGAKYERLREVKRRYDPADLFFVRHGVGSEGWSEDGFTPIGAP